MSPASRGATPSLEHFNSPRNPQQSAPNTPGTSQQHAFSTNQSQHQLGLGLSPQPSSLSQEKFDRDPYGAFERDERDGNAYAMSGKTKGDYSLIIDEEQNGAPPGARSVSSLAGANQGHMVVVDRVISHPALPIASYCVASILMTVVNKFVVSGRSFNMNFLLLVIQSVVCVSCVAFSKQMKLITFRDFDRNDARRWFPISFLLVSVIYTGSKSLQYLSIPVYTIFKNLTIILIAYGEVIWFGGHVTGLTLISFGFMVLSSLMAAWSDISHALATFASPRATVDPTVGFTETGSGAAASGDLREVVGNLNAGYVWMIINCVASAAYLLAMRKRIKVTNFKDWDTMFYNNLLSIPVLVTFSFLIEDWSAASLQRNFPAEGRTFLLFAMAFSGAAAVLISYTTAWCVRTTSSTTYSMVGALNKLPVAASGMIFFGDAVTLGSVSAISTGFVAGLVYAVAKANQSAQNQPGPKR